MIDKNTMDNKLENDIVFLETDTKNKDVIYFLNTGSSDAIILHSRGHFAMIDSGEDNDNPRGFSELEYKGYEQEILEFLRKNAADEDGKIHLDFVLGTHSHSDHIGGFDTIISDENVFIGKAYLKKYHAENINDHEVDDWDNQEVYDQMVEALNNKSVPIISDISSEPFKFGNFTLTILNTEYEDGSRKVGENDNSLVVLVEKDGKKALLTGDLDNYNHDEVKIGELVGRVDLLKVGHHSYSHSTEKEFLGLVSPKVSVITNSYENADKRTLKRIAKYTESSIIFSDNEGGIAAVFENDKITYVKNAGLISE
ncbi:MAG: MBL fold metallo-hydrolase [Acetobacter sp.]|nr:MBL fold metallo-hydrolase [Bacteroides sp.]MCM1340210.1 MBL fold metallo-hydrolase [Acetobacter sp.]MCM1432838.1 MBL fold metallo-hydrolase [Clostridiales bacterium]